jgi:hypothetical protein
MKLSPGIYYFPTLQFIYSLEDFVLEHPKFITIVLCTTGLDFYVRVL